MANLTRLIFNDMEKMKAVVYNKKGLPDKLIYCDVEKPVPNDNEVLIKVITVSANAADYRSIRMGLIPKKKIFGADIAGRVESVGKNIQQFKPGDEVIGDLSDCGFGGFAEYAVGTFAVQLAKYFGAVVTGVCSSKNVEQTSSLGADYVLDYTKEDFTKSSKRYDIILAINGGRSLSAYKRILNPNGVYVMVGGTLPQIFKSILLGWLMSFGSKKMHSLAAKSNQKDLEFLVKLAEDGKIKPVIDRRYSLDNTADAMRYLGKGHAPGKVVINVE